MSQAYDGGEAVLEAFRNLGVDYIISSPGTEWPPVWEALARQRANESEGPGYINCWHESLATAMAMGYTRLTGRLLALLLHAGVGPLQASMALEGAFQGEVPMLVCSGGSSTYGEDPDIEPGWQWMRNHGTVGGANRLVDPVVKWSSQVSSPQTLYETLCRAGELAQRVPKGPTYLNIPLEIMLHEWTPPARSGRLPAPPKTRPEMAAIRQVAELIASSRSPLAVTDSAGRNVEAFGHLVELAELTGMPVVEGSAPLYASFPKDHPLHLGNDVKRFQGQSDLFLVIGSSVPWYPPRSRPTEGTVVVIDENPIKAQMAYQSLQADIYLEGDVATTLRLLVECLRAGGAPGGAELTKRMDHWAGEHRKLQEGNQAAALAAKGRQPIDAEWLCAALNEAMPQDAIYIEETISHRQAILRQVRWNRPQSFFHPTGGLGLGLGLALGAKLAAPQRLVVALEGDGSFLYNPIVPALGMARENNLPILIVVFNNGGYSVVKRSHLQFYPQGVAASTGLFHGSDIPGPNYARLVEPFGGYGERVEDPEKLAPALRNALAAVKEGRVALLDVVLAA
jgi:thiamine pyrophosphate-dependent acetolactate synthase large subunit-like protein